MSEHRKRSLVKSITFRVIATLTTMVLVFLFTEELSITLVVGFLDTVTKLFIYYAHERTWNLIKWGKNK